MCMLGICVVVCKIVVMMLEDVYVMVGIFVFVVVLVFKLVLM